MNGLDIFIYLCVVRSRMRYDARSERREDSVCELLVDVIRSDDIKLMMVLSMHTHINFDNRNTRKQQNRFFAFFLSLSCFPTLFHSVRPFLLFLFI